MKSKPYNLNWWVVTDIDGTLMDHNYNLDPALPTIKWLKELSIPVIPCTSKTASEVRDLRVQRKLLKEELEKPKGKPTPRKKRYRKQPVRKKEISKIFIRCDIGSAHQLL